MERNITISLEGAREWYNSNNEALREIALKAFTEEELKQPWESIKTFEDVLKTLGIARSREEKHISTLTNIMPTNISRMMVAQYKLQLIKRALNGADWKPELNNGEIYYSWLRWYPKDSIFDVLWTKIGDFKDTRNNKNYTLLGYTFPNSCTGGLGGFKSKYGVARAFLGLQGCKNKEIAAHLINVSSG